MMSDTMENVVEPTEKVKSGKPRKMKGIVLSDTEFNCAIEYPDEYYDNYIRRFKPNTRSRAVYRFFKRAFDIVASLIGLILASPFMLLIAIAIKIESKGPVIFKQKRMGRYAKPFNCYKFRSMKNDAPHEMATSIMSHPEAYQTKVGRFLRKFSLDELPQLFCCLIGTMSIIGPRPLILSEQKCNGMREQMGVYKMRPGISGYAQVCGRDDVYYKNKAILDAEYVKHASLWLDIRLIFETVVVVLERRGNKDGETAAESNDSQNTEETVETETEAEVNEVISETVEVVEDVETVGDSVEEQSEEAVEK